MLRISGFDQKIRNIVRRDALLIMMSTSSGSALAWQAALDSAARRWSAGFGRGSQRHLLAAAHRALATVLDGDADAVCAAIEAAHVREHGSRALRAELDDERARDAAARDDALLVRYEEKWMRRLESLRRGRPARWHVRGLSDTEVRDALSLRLLEVLRGPSDARAQYDAPGREWGLSVMQHELGLLRKRYRLSTTPVDFFEAPLTARAPDHEARWLEAELEACRALAGRIAERELSRPQRRWLAALRASADRGDFFDSSQELNLSAASRLVGKNRSSALRAYRELQLRFQRELERLT